MWPNTALLVRTDLWYPPQSKEDADGRTSQSGGVAGVERVLGTFQVRFRRPEGREALERYTTGLLTELPNKNCDTITQAVPGTSEQQLQGLLTTTAWDEDDLNRQRVRRLLELPGEGDGVLIFDDT